MKNALIGHNGFIGSNLKYQTEFGFFLIVKIFIPLKIIYMI